MENKENHLHMAAHRAPSTRRLRIPGRRAAVALAVGAGVVLTPLPAFASAGPVAAVAAPSAPIVASSHAAQVAVNTAMAQLGKPYVWGAAGPGSFDCSGLALYAYKAAGISLPHSSAMQSRIGTPVSINALRPGDLVFFYSGPSHVGIYIGNGNVVHAPTTGDVVKVSPMKYMPFNSARRLA
jgi:cell wall-associated NlpC family hydrolase